MSHMVALNFEDGVTRFVECTGTETVVDASYRVGINIPLDCRDGACGTCKVFVEAGQFAGGDYIEDALTDDEAAEGYGLACQMKPHTDLVLRIAASSDVCKTKGASYKAQLAAVDRMSDTTLGFSLDVDPAAALHFLPGQYVNILVPGTDQKRSYSFSSTPGANQVSFLVRDIPRGLMSTFLRERGQPGAPVEFTGPSGAFYLREIKRPLLMLAGGTGLAPFLSMLGRIVQTGCDHPIHMTYGVTNDADLVGLDQLDAYAKQIPGFSFACCVADEASAYPSKGYVTRYIEPAHLNGGDVDVYLCGPPPMVDAVRHFLAEQAVSPANFYFEKFSPSGAVTAIGETHRA